MRYVLRNYCVCFWDMTALSTILMWIFLTRSPKKFFFVICEIVVPIIINFCWRRKKAYHFFAEKITVRTRMRFSHSNTCFLSETITAHIKLSEFPYKIKNTYFISRHKNNYILSIADTRRLTHEYARNQTFLHAYF